MNSRSSLITLAYSKINLTNPQPIHKSAIPYTPKQDQRKNAPKQISSNILLPPKRLTPLPPLHRDLLGQIIVGAVPVEVAPEEEERVVEVGEVVLDWDVVQPWG